MGSTAALPLSIGGKHYAKKKQSSRISGMSDTCCGNDCDKFCGTGGYVTWKRNKKTVSNRC
jgi:hypothetical protein